MLVCSRIRVPRGPKADLNYTRAGASSTSAPASEILLGATLTGSRLPLHFFICIISRVEFSVGVVGRKN